MCTAASFYNAHGTLPTNAGWYEQSATFIDALCLVLHEKVAYDAERQRIANEKARKQQQR